MSNKLLAAGAAMLAAIAAVPASAQLVTSSGITQSDYALMHDVALRLYRTDTAVAGKSENWSNSENGHRGTITVLKVFENAGTPCRRVKYELSFPQDASPTYVLTWCKVADGDWKIK